VEVIVYEMQALAILSLVVVFMLMVLGHFHNGQKNGLKLRFFQTSRIWKWFQWIVPQLSIRINYNGTW